jgi:hypothetical protein
MQGMLDAKRFVEPALMAAQPGHVLRSPCGRQRNTGMQLLRTDQTADSTMGAYFDLHASWLI